MIVLLFGPPGCGKGTQAAFIARRFDIPAISTGEVFRAEVKAGTPLGKAALAIMEAGGLVGDDVVNPMVANRIAQPDCAGGFLLDGYPRTMPQAEFLETVLREMNREQPVAIYLDVPAEVLVSRITSRRQCPQCGRIYNLVSQPPQRDGVCDIDGAALIQRADDSEAVIRERLKAYDAQTGPVIGHYLGRGGIRIDGNHPVDEIWKQIEGLLAAR
ncbi:MAG: adenylate kinase [Bryobacteraceae bacterium]